ncbi:MAG: rhodanese-like domain-containing protein [Myxococcota bacterium]
MAEIDELAPNASLNGVRIIDVREPEEFAGELGHIPGAELCPLGSLDIRAREWSTDEHYVLVCRSGKRARAAAERLKKQGFPRLSVLRGGMVAYNSLGRGDHS